MKKLLVVPGNSQRNKAWGEAAAQHFLEWFDVIYVQNYNHWSTGEERINFADEIEKIDVTVTDNQNEVGEWYVFAKSVGSLLALEAFADGVIDPKRAVFFGMPLDMAAKDIYAEDWSALSEFTVPSLAFHNQADPTTSHDFTVAKLQAYGNEFTIVSTEGDTHDYLDFAEYEPYIKEFLSS
jgi:hypothetical protein